MKPIIAVTMGDPSGIGPEVIVKGLLEKTTYTRCRPFVVGDPNRMSEAAARFAPELSIRRIKTLSEARFQEGTVEILEPPGKPLPSLEYGKAEPPS